MLFVMLFLGGFSKEVSNDIDGKFNFFFAVRRCSLFYRTEKISSSIVRNAKKYVSILLK